MIENILPAVITILGNLAFYFWIKGRVDKSLEKHKISYGEIFKEKVNIYRDLLEKTYSLKNNLNRFQNVGSKEDGTAIMENINEYCQFYSKNQPFLSDEMLTDLNILQTELKDIFNKFYRHIANTDSEYMVDFILAGNKLNDDITIRVIEDRIIQEMRRDLKINNFGN